MSTSLPDPDDAVFDPADPTRPGRAPRPRDAATLILVRRARQGPEALMGQRARGHVFMPNKWVFPGGRVDRGDAHAFAASELASEDALRLRARAGRRAPRAFALAAVRETFEEAGLIVGTKAGRPRTGPANWRDFTTHGAAPELAKLAFVARAITPPYRPRRFDARFFLADAEETLLSFDPVACGDELLQTRWISLEDAARLDLPAVTRFVLGEIAARLEGQRAGPPFLRWTRRGHQMERL